MARICKSLIPPEQGYAHRDHRSAKGRKQFYQSERFRRIQKQKRLDKIQKKEIEKVRGIIYE